MADPDVDWEGDLSEGEEEELDDDEWEEETTYVVLDLGPNFAEGNLLEEAIARNGTYQLVGLDRANPFLRIGTAYFKGERVETIGTDLVFAAENHPGPASAPAAGAQRQSQGWRRITSRPPVPPPGSFQPPPPQQRKEPTLVCKTTKRIMFQQVKLSLKGEEAGEAAASGEAPQANGPEVEPSVSARRTCGAGF
ncbi:hypothetical protein DFJ74DRAFT_741235 [Hyaloraphidium curvatum]|nr:hypothetical protein DFJ74DRAFT_741235 [Hyaloraphidium curvatum]